MAERLAGTVILMHAAGYWLSYHPARTHQLISHDIRAELSAARRGS
jgi:hypothetical protein